MNEDSSNFKKHQVDKEIILAEIRKIPVVFRGNSIGQGRIDLDSDFIQF